MQNSRIITFSLVSVIFWLSSCNDNSFINEDILNTGNCISFSTTDHNERHVISRHSEDAGTFSIVDENDSTHTLHCDTYQIPLETSLATRVSATTQLSQISQIGVIADASWFEPRLMNNDLYTLGDNGVYSSENVCYWIDDADASIDFYAFAPYSPKGLTLPTQKGQTTLNYTVPVSTDDQADLMLAVNKGVIANYGQTVGLAFKHLLAGVRINFDYPANFTIKKVSLTGLTKSATLDFSSDQPQWYFGDDHSLSVQELEIGQFAQFMVFPQTISEAQTVTLSIEVDDENGVEHIYSHVFNSGEWRMGINTVYDVTITNYSFELTTSVPADAHYVLYKTQVKAGNLRADTPWTLTCSASDDAEVTIQNEADINDFVKNGFWTDKIIDGANQTSARGTNSLTFSGNGTFPITIFIPENATDADRNITLNIRVYGKNVDEKPLEFTQLHPAWTTSGFGWEQTDDNINGEYGFKWNRVLYYGYNYSAPLIGGNNTTYQNYCQSIINENNASHYASVVTFNVIPYVNHRYAIKIDYGKLSDIGTIANSNSNGLSNTKGLYNFGGAAATNAFVTTLENIKKTESGVEDQAAFRLGNGDNRGGHANAPEGDPVTNSAAIGECMKKNRFNLKRYVSSEGNVTLTVEISDADIVWYLPAVDQFNYVPASIADPINKASYWSSTCVDDRANAYLGNGTQAERLTTHSVRAVRNH